MQYNIFILRIKTLDPGIFENELVNNVGTTVQQIQVAHFMLQLIIFKDLYVKKK